MTHINNSEHRMLQHVAPDYDRLPLLNKLEAFELACRQTDGKDLSRVLWLRSQSSEVWLERRTNYTRSFKYACDVASRILNQHRTLSLYIAVAITTLLLLLLIINSLAVMSMVGYILGLGDRHPSNLMLDRFSGKILHIDFGDCFEVAMQRDKFPERVPFRLTRMLVNAMEVSRIEGNFRSTCEDVMRVLRANKDSVMAMLEAFVHDPLISWRLLAPPRVSPTATAFKPTAAVNKYKHARHCFNSLNAQLLWLLLHTLQQVDDTNTADDDAESDDNASLDGNDHDSNDATTTATASMNNTLGISVHRSTKTTSSSSAALLLDDTGGVSGSALSSTAASNAANKWLFLHARTESQRVAAAAVGGGKPLLQRESQFEGAKEEERAAYTGGEEEDQLNARAIAVIERIQMKLTGRDFVTSAASAAGGSSRSVGNSSRAGKDKSALQQQLGVEHQVDQLIQQATDVHNLCQLFT
eukprot:4616-Heterococcus_DN1.PRE.2